MFKIISLNNTPFFLALSAFFRSFMLVVPVIVLVYGDKGLTLGEFFLLQGIFYYVVFFMEIPTGYLGDLFSRKKVLLMSAVMLLSAFVLLYFAHGFFWIFFVELLMGFSNALSSGTRQAYLYDVLKKQGKENLAIKEEGRISASAIFGTTFAIFAGGAIYNYLGIDFLLIIQILTAVFAFVMLLFLPDVTDMKRVVAHGKSKLKDIWDISKYAIQHPEIKWLSVFPAAFGAGTLVLMWGLQPLMELALIPVALFGVFIGVSSFMRGLFSHYAGNLFYFFKTKNFTILLFVILILGFAASILASNSQNFYLVSILILITGIATSSQAGLSVVKTSMINHRVKSDERATVLSVSSMVGAFFCGTILILIKFVVDGYSLQDMYIFTALLLLPVIFICMKKLLKLKL